MIEHTKPPAPLTRYVTTVPANAPVEVGTYAMHPNSALCIQAKGDNDFTLRITVVDTLDNVGFNAKDYLLTAATPRTIYHRGGVGAKIEIIAGAANVTPDVRVYGMGQP
jgi:hypothetical protein